MAQITKQEQSKSPVRTNEECAQLKQIESMYTKIEGRPRPPLYPLELEDEEFTGVENSEEEAKKNAASGGVSEFFKGTPPKSTDKQLLESLEHFCHLHQLELKFDDKEFTGVENSKKEGKRNAASGGVCELFEGTPPKSTDKQLLESLEHFCHLHQLELKFDDKEFTGVGNSNEKAKRNAAFSEIPELFKKTHPKCIAKEIPPYFAEYFEYFSNLADKLEREENTRIRLQRVQSYWKLSI